MAKKKVYIPARPLNMAAFDSRIKKLENRIATIQLESKFAENALKDFIVLITNFASHDIKNLVHSIDGIVSNVTSEDITAEDINNIKLCIDHIRITLDNFSEFNVVKKTDVSFEVQKVFTSLDILHRPLFKTEKIQFDIEYDISFNKEDHIEHDFHSMLFMFNNLIFNSTTALKNIEKAFIKLTVSTMVNENKRMLRVVVRDNGSGIKDEIRSKIFEPYFTTKTGGTGVGLSHVKWLLEKMDGGSIVLLNENSIGATFEIIIPFQNKNAIDE